jgi:hypothetical protein
MNMTHEKATEQDMGVSSERLRELAPILREQIRLLEHRLSRSAIPEDGWEFAPMLADAQLELALITELLALRAAKPAPEWQGMPQDVIALVIAAREYWEFTITSTPDELADALDKALEPFASRVPYENEPIQDTAK